MLTVHRTTIRRVIPGPVPGARPWVLPVFDNDSGQAVSARVLDNHEGKPASACIASGASVAPASNSTPRAVRGCPTTATASFDQRCVEPSATPTQEASHEVNDGRTAREPTTRNERPVCGDAAGCVTTAAGAAESPCRTDAAYTNTNGGSAADGSRGMGAQ